LQSRQRRAVFKAMCSNLHRMHRIHCMRTAQDSLAIAVPGICRGSQKLKGVVLDRRLLFHKHVSAVARSCTGHPTHSTLADYGTGTDTGLQSYPVQDRLLQCCATQRSKLQHQEVAASTEQRSSDRSRSTKTIPQVSPLLRTLHWLPFSRGSITKWLCWLLKSAAPRPRCTCDS